MARRFRLEEVSFNFRCQESWSGMDGEGVVRHCGSCDKDVHDLSGLTRAEGEALLTSTKGRICVRMYRTGDGRVITADEPPTSEPIGSCGGFTPGRLQPRRRNLLRRLGAGAAAAAVVLQPGSCESGGTSGDIGEPTPSWPTFGVPDLVPLMGEPVFEPMVGRLAPLEVLEEAPVELLGDVVLDFEAELEEPPQVPATLELHGALGEALGYLD